MSGGAKAKDVNGDNSDKYGKKNENVVRNIGSVSLEELLFFKVCRTFIGHLLGTL